ncbi:MAG: carboxypeptidase-like regulatory domain-containing protein [Planctomycetales bacterium]|nr:carboxypeptidase-like regulatory domain-containing protein [Planctomycetales bacterium]
MNKLCCRFLMVSMLALILAGCGGSGPRLYKMQGTVTYNGKPVQGAQVSFSYPDGNFANGDTDATGKYNLSYVGGVGAKPGMCDVTVTKMSTTATAAPTGAKPEDMLKAMKDYADAQKNAAAPKNELPQKYADPKTSGLKFEIKTSEKDNVYNIDLKD